MKKPYLCTINNLTYTQNNKVMVRCDICKRSVFDNNKTIVNLGVIKDATHKGFVPSYYLERDKEGIEYGLPRERKWRNIVKNFPRQEMCLCKFCNEEMNNALKSKAMRVYYCYIATVAFESADAPEVNVLRNYRDEVLMKTYFGRCFIALYYFISPSIARLMLKSEKLRLFIRNKILIPIVRKIAGRRLEV